MFLSEISIKRHVFTVMVTVALMTLGLLGARSIGVDLFPDVSFPVVTVVTPYPGAAPEEVRSYWRASPSTIVVQFKRGIDVKRAGAAGRERVSGVRRKLPADIKDP